VLSKAYSLREAARLAGVAKDTLRAWLVEAGYELPRLAHAAKWRIPESVLEQVLASREVKPAVAEPVPPALASVEEAKRFWALRAKIIATQNAIDAALIRARKAR